MTETLANIFGKFALPLSLQAVSEYRHHGRGILIVGFYDQYAGPWSAKYVDLATAQAAGFTAELTEAVKTYDPDREGLVFLNCGESARLFTLGLAGSNQGDPARN